MATAFERATELVARQLASFRLGLDCGDPFSYTENEKLMAGHIIGSLWANDLLKWVHIRRLHAGSWWQIVPQNVRPLPDPLPADWIILETRAAPAFNYH